MLTRSHVLGFWLPPNLPQAKTNVTFRRPAFVSIVFGVHCNPTRHMSISSGGWPGRRGMPYMLCRPFLGLCSDAGTLPHLLEREGVQCGPGAGPRNRVRLLSGGLGLLSLPAVNTKPRKTGGNKKQKLGQVCRVRNVNSPRPRGDPHQVWWMNKCESLRTVISAGAWAQV